MYGDHTYSRVIWINRVRWPNLLVVSSTRKLSILAQCADASVVSIYTHGTQSPRVHETAAIQESVLFGSETCVERSHSIFGTNVTKIDVQQTGILLVLMVSIYK